jgi:EAL domain-containing protein (putative c-di-GMP-specific phosphodiesterase class I)
LSAAGVETAEQLDTLRGLGGAFGQGYLLGAPQPAPGEQLVDTAYH